MTPTPAPVSSSPFTASAPLTVPPVAPLASFLKWVRRIDDSPSEGTSTSQTVPSVLLLDGGVSTFLENELARKGNVFDPPSLWSSSLLLTETGHDEIRDAHWAYGAAGANILSSVTYQCHYGTYKANPHKRTKVVEDDSVMTRLIRDGIRLAVEEGLNRYVAVSLGCYGAALTDGAEYTGDYHGITDHALQQFHARKLKTVLDYINTVPVDTDDTTGSDDTTTNGTHHAQNVLLAFETVPSVQEVHAIVSVLHQAKAKTIGRAVWLSLACSDGETLNDGSPIEEALDAISEMDPDGDYVHAIGINCCGVQHGVSYKGRERKRERERERERQILWMLCCLVVIPLDSRSFPLPLCRCLYGKSRQELTVFYMLFIVAITIIMLCR